MRRWFCCWLLADTISEPSRCLRFISSTCFVGCFYRPASWGVCLDCFGFIWSVVTDDLMVGALNGTLLTTEGVSFFSLRLQWVLRLCSVSIAGPGLWGVRLRYWTSVAAPVPVLSLHGESFVEYPLPRGGFNFPLLTTTNLERLLFSFPLRAIRAIRAIRTISWFPFTFFRASFRPKSEDFALRGGVTRRRTRNRYREQVYCFAHSWSSKNAPFSQGSGWECDSCDVPLYFKLMYLLPIAQATWLPSHHGGGRSGTELPVLANHVLICRSLAHC
jgi:hypothetical protein